jgi:hypothetical protein
MESSEPLIIQKQGFGTTVAIQITQGESNK